MQLRSSGVEYTHPWEAVIKIYSNSLLISGKCNNNIQHYCKYNNTPVYTTNNGTNNNSLVL